MRGRGILGAVAASLAALVTAPVAGAASEAQVKAAYLVKLASFVSWPVSAAGDTFRICTSGRPDGIISMGREAR